MRAHAETPNSEPGKADPCCHQVIEVRGWDTLGLHRAVDIDELRQDKLDVVLL